MAEQSLYDHEKRYAAMRDAAPALYEALDPANVRHASKALIESGHGLLGGLLILMADNQEAAMKLARGEQ